MVKCPNGHEGGTSLRCGVCGAPVSYMDSLSELLEFPRVNPDFGDLALLFVGVPSLRTPSDYAGEVAFGDGTRLEPERFVIGKGSGATWHDLYVKHSQDMSRWLKLVAFADSKHKVLVVDATDTRSVLAVASLPKSDGTVVLAVSADLTSTPVEQNTTYVALTVALRKGFEVVVFPQGIVREAMLVSENGALASDMGAFAGTLQRLLAMPEDLLELLEGDHRLGVNLHVASPVSSGSMKVYGSVANAVAAQAYQLPPELDLGEVRAFHSVVWCGKDLRQEFEKRFNQFRRSAVKSAINSECRFVDKDGGGGFFEIFTLFGTSEPVILQASLEGYNAVVRRAPDLKVGSVS